VCRMQNGCSGVQHHRGSGMQRRQVEAMCLLVLHLMLLSERVS
jgi:hypothetical protein